jgi:hypothetical protein
MTTRKVGSLAGWHNEKKWERVLFVRERKNKCVEEEGEGGGTNNEGLGVMPPLARAPVTTVRAATHAPWQCGTTLVT